MPKRPRKTLLTRLGQSHTSPVGLIAGERRLKTGWRPKVRKHQELTFLRESIECVLGMI